MPQTSARRWLELFTAAQVFAKEKAISSGRPSAVPAYPSSMRGGCFWIGLLLGGSSFAPAQVYEESPIHYSRRRPSDLVTQWSRTLPKGEPAFDRSSHQAFLESVLEELGVAPESQLLVFSTTSFQTKLIDGERPRALYFNEDHYVGFVQNGPIELATVDPRMGLNFYTLSVPKPEDPGPPLLHRDAACITCHADNTQTEFPGLMAMSVFAAKNGAQVLQGLSVVTDDRRELAQRWGGWYVTGRIDGPRHRGNTYFAPTADPSEPPAVAEEFGTSVEDLAAYVRMEPYLKKTSDVVALMVFEHQLRVHNQLLEAFGRSRIALYADPDFLSNGSIAPPTEEILDREVEDLLDAMLFRDEADLSQHEIEGDEAFQKAFAENARRDGEGRSLKDFDLKDRLFRHRLSYMIYSQSFDLLPDPFKERFFERLDEVLASRPEDDRFTHLPVEERRAIRSIVKATLPRL